MYCQYIKFTDVLITRTQKGLLMAIRLDELFDKTKRTFELKLIAGKGGLNHIVGWVHLLKTRSFSTGSVDRSWLSPLV